MTRRRQASNPSNEHGQGQLLPTALLSLTSRTCAQPPPTTRGAPDGRNGTSLRCRSIHSAAHSFTPVATSTAMNTSGEVSALSGHGAGEAQDPSIQSLTSRMAYTPVSECAARVVHIESRSSHEFVQQVAVVSSSAPSQQHGAHSLVCAAVSYPLERTASADDGAAPRPKVLRASVAQGRSRPQCVRNGFDHRKY